MDLSLSVKSKIFLKWVTVRPYYVGASCMSPDFGILQNEWYLELKISRYINQRTGTYDYYYEIWIHPRPSPSPSNFLLPVDSELKVRGISFSQSENLRNNTQSICLLKRRINREETCSSGDREEWEVICTFRDLDACNPFSLQVGNKTVCLSCNKNSPLKSVDECVQVSSEISHDIEALSSDISGLLKDEMLPDFKLECGGRSFPVHRSVLAARSEVFRAMIRNKMLESETGSADIKDLEVPVLESFLEFLYSGKLKDLTDVSASNLYEAADKYAVHSLRAACSYWMVRNLTEDNCVSYLSIADSHSDTDLKAAAITFILDRPRVFESSAWLKFSENHIKEAFEVLQAYAASTIQRSSNDD